MIRTTIRERNTYTESDNKRERESGGYRERKKQREREREAERYSEVFPRQTTTLVILVIGN